ncbi:unnamed protein product [Gulo gulo]|uniref:Uncharacterized protein n=1 Tax=Gulo gulo TaxID=48420 RepID=A0A9X9PSZ6_GULGU|nr:unnamed protein product [Gulo gulo]
MSMPVYLARKVTTEDINREVMYWYGLKEDQG